MTTVKIALLLCGGLTGKAYEEHGDYYDIYSTYLNHTLPSGLQLKVDPYEVVREMAYPSNDDEYDCIMLTGSAASAYENLEWINKLVAYVARIAETKPHIKLIGICFGHQIVARALGGECVPNGGRWEVGPTNMQLTAIGKQIFGEGNNGILSIQQMHRDHVPTTPPTFELLGSTSISPNQGMVRFLPSSLASSPTPRSIQPPSHEPPSDSSSRQPLPQIQILTLQGHPEFTQPIVTSLVEQRSASGVIDAEAAKDADRRRSNPTDGDRVVAPVIWEIILQGKK